MSSEPSSSYAAGLKGAELSKWLENKLGPSDDLWCSRNICAHLSQEILANCQTCFVDLQTSVKLKLLLSFIHLGRRNLELWREEIEDVIHLASQDADDWVQTIAELLRDFPTTTAINFTGMEDSTGHFARALEELKESLRQVGKESQLLPIESTYMNKPALMATFGTLTPPVKHFSLKRKSKAAALRSDLLLKASDAASHVKTKGVGVSSVVPIRPRTMAKVNNNAPLKGLPQNVLKSNSQFTASRSSVRPSAPKREGGIKLIELDDVPILLKNRRKSAKAAELAKEKEKKVPVEEEENDKDGPIESIINDVVTTTSTSAYEELPSASVVPLPSEKRRRSTKNESEPKAKRSRVKPVDKVVVETADSSSDSESFPVPSRPVPQVVPPVISQPPTVMQTPISRSYPPDLSAAMATAQTVLARTDIESTERISVIIKPTEAQATVSQDWPRQPQLFTPAVSQQPFGTAILPGTQPFFMSTTTPTATVAGGQLSNYQNFSGAQPSAAFFSPFGAASHSQAQQSAAAAAPVAKPMLSLSKEVMIAAQEMFKSANKLSRPEKALILGFMAGSRDNPCPHMGEVLTVRLSERLELAKVDPNQQQLQPQHLVVEDFFQMNYATGEWKKLSKSRPAKTGGAVEGVEQIKPDP